VTHLKNILLILLAGAVLALGVVSVVQYRELIGLRAQLADGDNATLKKQLAEARKTIRSLENRIAELRGRRSGAEGQAEAGDGEPAAENRGPRGGNRFAAFAELSANPEFQKLLAVRMKGQISQIYGPLFKALNLTPDQLSQFQSLLLEKQQSLADVMQAAREQGINPRVDPDGFKTLLNQATSQIDASIQQSLGDSGFQQYTQYQQTLPERNVVNTLQQSLSYTQTPLTDDQANQMIALLQQNQPQRSGNGTAGAANGGTQGPSVISLMNGGGTAKVTSDAVTAASGVLSAPQISALQQIQLQQQAQQQIQQMMRGSNPGSATPPAAAQPATPGAKG
jgi:hypothetical protein